MKLQQLALSTLISIAWVGVHAADTKPLQVTATITDTCAFRTVPTALGLGIIDPLTNNAVTQSATVRYTCTLGSSASVTVGASNTGAVARVLKKVSAATQTIPYTITWVPPTTQGRGHGSGNEIELVLNARIEPSGFQNAMGGDYADEDLTLTISP